jgi:hypothetical protein
LNDETLRASLRAQGEPAPTTPEYFESYIRAETAKWTKVIRRATSLD